MLFSCSARQLLVGIVPCIVKVDVSSSETVTVLVKVSIDVRTSETVTVLVKVSVDVKTLVTVLVKVSVSGIWGAMGWTVPAVGLASAAVLKRTIVSV